MANGSARVGGHEFDVWLPPEQEGGVWANDIEVSFSEHEFTLDFIRLDHPRQRGVVVARVAISPGLMTRVIDLLGPVWSDYAGRAMPPEVHDE